MCDKRPRRLLVVGHWTCKPHLKSLSLAVSEITKETPIFGSPLSRSRCDCMIDHCKIKLRTKYEVVSFIHRSDISGKLGSTKMKNYRILFRQTQITVRSQPLFFLLYFSIQRLWSNDYIKQAILQKSLILAHTFRDCRALTL